MPDKPDRRAAIVEAALAVIGETGPAGFTQPRVAARAGLRQSHLTYYYPTRDDLLVAVAEEAVRRRVALLADAQARADGIDEHIAALATVLAAPEQTRILLALTQAADQNDAVRAAFGALTAGVGPIAARFLAAAGVEADPATVALLQATSTGVAVLALARDEDATVLADQLLHALVDRLAGSSS